MTIFAATYIIEPMKRASGILLHIANLPSAYGIGQLGKPAFDFVDFLAEAGQSYWQVLPLVPTGYGDSPYQSCCASAGSEYFIDIESLTARGLLEKKETAELVTYSSSRIDYERLFFNVTGVLRKAFARADRCGAAFAEFLRAGEYADYALFRAIKEYFGHKAWCEWPDGYKFRDEKTVTAFKKAHAEDILFWQWCQFEFFAEWSALKKYANDRGVKIIGDIPIYVAYDSVECWTRPELMQLDGDLSPTVVAGCPPDYFSEDGQLWGNPVYNWDIMKADGYAWWKSRLAKCFRLFDLVRIDHFRGFDRFFTIKFGAPNATEGEWQDGPSTAMFKEIERETGSLSVIAEDLGTLDDSARAMFAEVGYPGMKILEYAFDSPDNDYLPSNYASGNCVVYPGTHDNDTLAGFIGGMTWEQSNAFREAVLGEYSRLGLAADIECADDLRRAVIRLGFESKALLVVVQLQDFMGIGSEGRINEPSTLSTKNWSYRVPADYATQELATEIKSMTKETGRE